MKKVWKIIIGLVLVLVIGVALAWFGFLRPEPLPISEEDRAQIKLMPLPAMLELGKGNFKLDSDFGYALNGPSSEKLKKGLKRFYAKLNKVTDTEIKNNSEAVFLIEFENLSDSYPALRDDESYSLTVSNSEIKLSANFETGILHGLESLLQLLEKDNGIWVFPELEIVDNPRYPWRGLMIDVARHWVSKETIIRNLDAMAAVKMNVLHLHLTDYQGFRVESKKFPKLHEMGSQGNYYSQEDIKEMVNYAADRGIRVVPEFDLPGHTTAWFVGYPELASVPGPYTLDSIFGILDPVMDPTRDEVYDFLEVFIGEMATIFPDEYLHIGGDEVKLGQWNENHAIQEFMKKQKIENTHKLQAYFNIRLQKIVAKHNKKMMGWDEIIDPDLPKDGIAVQSWRSHKSLWDAAKSGHKAILSYGYYLDHKRPASYHYAIDPMKIDGGVTIDIDSTNWKAYECKLFVQGSEIDGFLYFFGEDENLRGVMSAMGDTNDFSNAKIEQDRISFQIESSVGTINFETEIKGDSLMGEAKIALFTIDLKGKQIGSSTMVDGIPLPKFEKIAPLTQEEEKNILGGEACMWSEMVSNQTIDSRIWPRAAVIAEKLWSQKVLTGNADDMYRRLMLLDKELETMGVQHTSNGKKLVAEIASEAFKEPAQNLVDVLQEDDFFNRMQIYRPVLYTTTPLNRFVDAARPESYIAYRFNKDVAKWIETEDSKARARIIQHLNIWSENYTHLLPVFDPNQKFIENRPLPIISADLIRMKEIQTHSANLSQLSKITLEHLNGTAKDESAIDSLLLEAKKPRGGMVLPIVDGLEKLLKNSN